MTPIFKKTLFIFRRDLRLEDNVGLISALQHSEIVIPCFVFTPEQIKHNPYKSTRCLQFMIESLEDLQMQFKKQKGKLFLFFDPPELLVMQCIQKLKIDAVFLNRDYTPYSQIRDERIARVCLEAGIAFHSYEDALLHSPESTLKTDGSPYTIFTPFYRNASKLPIPPPMSNKYDHYFQGDISFAQQMSLLKEIAPNRSKQQPGGRTAALAILKNLSSFSNYPEIRDFPCKQGTTHLSAHLKFTTCSPREVYYELVKHLGTNSELIRSLYWRDFFSCIAYHFPHVFKGSFHKKFEGLNWNNSKNTFMLWCTGRTGFPIVDAGMREMNNTGFMHNRVRMITASFLVKDLHINWRWGEKYFAQSLIDYDPAVNNGNWQWAASTGCDAQPYFRIFNPWLQQRKFDPECTYIKQWIPELANCTPKRIHQWDREYTSGACSYPQPIIDHALESKKALEKYKTSLKTHNGLDLSSFFAG